LGYGSLAAAEGCCGTDEDWGGGGAKLSRVEDGGGALPGPDDDRALDGSPSEHKTQPRQLHLPAATTAAVNPLTPTVAI